MSIDFTDPLGIKTTAGVPDGTYRATTAREMCGYAYFQCWEQLADFDAGHVTRDDIHDLRENFHRVACAALASTSSHRELPWENKDLDNVTLVGKDGVDLAFDVDDITIGDELENFHGRWRLLRIDAQGDLVFGLQLECSSSWETYCQFQVDGRSLLGDAILPYNEVVDLLYPFILTARRARCVSFLAGISDWCRMSGLEAESCILEAIMVAFEGGSVEGLATIARDYIDTLGKSRQPARADDYT